MNWTNRDKIMLTVFGALYVGIMILICRTQMMEGHLRELPRSRWR